MKDIGDRIKETRQARGITQSELARRVGLATVTIRQYENGSREPRLDTIKQIATALDVQPEYLLTEKLHDLYNRVHPKSKREDGKLTVDDLLKGGTFQDYVNDYAQLAEMVFGLGDYQSDMELYDNALKESILDVLSALNIRGKEAALRHLEELAQIPAYQAGKKAPAGEKPVDSAPETSPDAPETD